MGTLSTSGILPAEQGFDPGGLPGEVLIALFLCLAFSRRFLPGLPPSDRNAPVWRDGEVKLGLLIVVAVALILLARHWIASDARGTLADAGSALWGGLFAAVSYLTTTGYPSGAWEAARGWSGLDSPGLVLMGLAIFGGGVATTAGGVKLLRVYALFRHAERELERTIHPSSVGGRGDSGRRLRQEGALLAWVFFLFFALAIGVTVALLTLTGLTFQTALVLAVSALTSCGPLAAVAGDAPILWSSLEPAQKAITGLAMAMGRLELLAVMALTVPDGWRR
jgi:trk system potassium uptake protein